MKIAHSVIVTPHRCGLYETARELVEAERRLGFDARIVDPVGKKEAEDRSVPCMLSDWAKDADVLVNHSGFNAELERVDVPVIHVAHGIPRSSFLLELGNQQKIYTYLYSRNTQDKIKAVVTFWPEYKEYFELLMPDKPVVVVPPSVDLNTWTPSGLGGYDFGGMKGDINVICPDVWREGYDPFHVVNAFLLFALQHPEINAKLHIYGASKNRRGWDTLFQIAKDIGCLGEIHGWVSGLWNVYRAADIAITQHRVASRGVRESLACGSTLVAATGNQFTPYTAAPENLQEYADEIYKAATNLLPASYNRRVAEREFNPTRTATEMLEVIKQYGSR